MKNYLRLINESQRAELRQRVALELFIENFSRDDLYKVFEEVSQERMTNLALSLSEDYAQTMQARALAKFGSIADEIVDQEQKRGQFFFVQVAQVLVDFGNQNSLL